MPLHADSRVDETTFGILSSRLHELWSLRLGTRLEDRARYTPTTTVQTFTFPEGLTLDIPAASYANDRRATAIAQAAHRLLEPEIAGRLPRKGWSGSTNRCPTIPSGLCRLLCSTPRTWADAC